MFNLRPEGWWEENRQAPGYSPCDYVVRRLHLGGRTVTHHADLVSAFRQLAAWRTDDPTRKVTLTKVGRA